ncbi:MAG: rhodanese-like domain-containing protein [Gallionella sp.]
MKNQHSINRLLSELCVGLLLWSGSGACMAGVTDIQPIELMQRIKANNAGLILDVRTPEEYAEGHIPGAINIPHDQLGSRHQEIAAHKNKDIVLYCRSGGRVGIAANILQAAGFSKLLHLAGDMGNWRMNGNLPIKK